MLETIYSVEYHYGGNDPYIICNLSSPPGTPDYLLKPHLFSLILATCCRLCELPQPLRRVEPQPSGVMHDITLVPASKWKRIPWPRFLHLNKQTDEIMRQGGTDLYLDVHVRCVMCNIETLWHRRTSSLHHRRIILDSEDFSVKHKAQDPRALIGTSSHLRISTASKLHSVHYFTATTSIYPASFPTGTTGYWMCVILIITTGEISWEIILRSTLDFIYSVAKTV